MQGLTEQERRDLILSVGTHRRDRRLSPLEVAVLVERLRSSGMTRKQCADALGLGASQVGVFLGLLDLAEDVQHLADWRGTRNATIPFSTLAELARLNKRDQIIATHRVLKYGLTWKEVVQVVQIANRSDKNIEQCVEDVIKLRPTTTIHHVFVGAITRLNLSAVLEAIPQADRDKRLERVLRSIIGPGLEFKSRLGARDFTILTDQDLCGLLGVEPDEFEELVNSSLADVRVEIEISD